MPKYAVCWEVAHQYEAIVEAESKEEAIEKSYNLPESQDNWQGVYRSSDFDHAEQLREVKDA